MGTDIRTVEDISTEVIGERSDWRGGYPVMEMLKRIVDAGVVSYEGKVLRVVGWDIKDGDYYLTGRNLQSGVNGVRFLKAKFVDRENGWVLPEQNAYPFDIGECLVVEPVE